MDPHPAAPPLPELALSVVRRVEPFTGLDVLDVNGRWLGPEPTAPLAVEIRYDGTPVLDTPLTVTAFGAKGSPYAAQFQFGTQVLLEADARSVQVVLRTAGGETELFDGPVPDGRVSEEIGAARRGPFGKLSGIAERAWRSVRTGEIFSPWRWAARLRRVREKLVGLRQRARLNSLLKRGTPGSRSVEAGCADSVPCPTRSRSERATLGDPLAEGGPLAPRAGFEAKSSPQPELNGNRSPCPIRALVVTHNLNHREGAPRQLFEIVAGLVRRGRLAPTVFSPLAGPGEADYAALGVPVRAGGVADAARFTDGRWTPLAYEAAQRYALRLLRETRPELVIVNTLPGFPLVEAAARLGVPAVWLIHESYSEAQLRQLLDDYARPRCEACFALAARVVFVSRESAARFARLNVRGNFAVSHNGLEAGPFDDYLRRVDRKEAERLVPVAPDRKRIVAVGNVCERKGQHVLVHAAARLAASGRRDFACYLVGAREGVPYVNYVRNLIRRYGLEEFVYLVPETEQVWAYLRAADVFVCSSYLEAYSRSVLEAEAFGLPVVSTPCCGVGEQVAWGRNALRFEPGDADALAGHLGRLLSDDGLRRAMGEASRTLFDAHLSFGGMIDHYEQLLSSVARPEPSARPASAAARQAA